MYEILEDFGKDVLENEKYFLKLVKGPNKNGDTNDGRCDMDVDFTIKESNYKNQRIGETNSKNETYFCYRYHLLAVVNYELPIEYMVRGVSK